MGIFNKINQRFSKRKLKVKNENIDYSDKVIEFKEKIIASIPDNLSNLEKSYYIYIELGKELSENPANVFDMFNKHLLSLKPIGNDFQGNCKAISTLYVNILKDPRVNIDADLITSSQQLGSHVDAIIKIGNKEYITNLIGDLSRIQTGQKTHYFGFNLQENQSITYNFRFYKKKIQRCYQNLESIPRETLDTFDKKFKYSSYPLADINSKEPGIYTEDVFKRLQEELQNPETFNKYVLKGKQNVPNEDILKYKLEFLFENMDRFSTYPGKKPEYLEDIRYYYHTFKKLFSEEEISRLNFFTTSNSFSEFSCLDSVIKLNTPEGNKTRKDYYIYKRSANSSRKKYIPISKSDLQNYFNKKVIIGERDIFNPLNVSDLEL